MSVMHNLQSKSRGFTLIEVMVAFIIIAVGLLGVLALQNRSLQYNHLAFLDSQAQLLITDIVERIRANPQQAADYQVDFDDGTPTASKDCSSAVCTAGEIKTWDLAEWLNKVKSQTYLPGAKGEIVYTASNRQLSVSIQYSLANVDDVPTSGETLPRTLTIRTRVY